MEKQEKKEYSRKERSLKTLTRTNAAKYYIYPLQKTEDTLRLMALKDVGFRYVPYKEPTDAKICAFMMKKLPHMDDTFTQRLTSQYGPPLIMNALELIDEIGDYDVVIHMSKGNTYGSFARKQPTPPTSE
jgi:hypothetical protein